MHVSCSRYVCTVEHYVNPNYGKKTSNKATTHVTTYYNLTCPPSLHVRASQTQNISQAGATFLNRLQGRSPCAIDANRVSDVPDEHPDEPLRHRGTCDVEPLVHRTNSSPHDTTGGNILSRGHTTEGPCLTATWKWKHRDTSVIVRSGERGVTAGEVRRSLGKSRSWYLPPA